MDKNIDRLDRAFHFIMETFVRRGYAPHFTELSMEFGLTPDGGRSLLHEVVDTRVMPMWLYPGTDLIVFIAPFEEDMVSNLDGLLPKRER